MKAKSTIRKYRINKLPAGKTDIAKLRTLRGDAIEFDDEAPELTPTILKKLGKPSVRLRGQRGPQKTPTKIQISLRVDRDVLEAYKATGEGYLSLMNSALRANLKAAPRVKTKTAVSVVKRPGQRS